MVLLRLPLPVLYYVLAKLSTNQSRHIASVGATLTILSLAFDFFSQQLIALRVVEVPNAALSRGATVPRAASVESTLYQSLGYTRELLYPFSS